MNNKVTYGLIGVGAISKNQHLPNLSRAKHIHLKTICDIRQDVLGEIIIDLTAMEAISGEPVFLGMYAKVVV